MNGQLQALAGHPFARDLSEPQLRRLLTCTRSVRFPAGAFLLQEGGQADTLYLLRTGRVALEQHVPGRGPTQLESLGPGDILGLSWLFPARNWTLDARAVEPVEAFALDSACLKEQMATDASLGLLLATRLIQQLYQRLVAVRLQRLDLYQAEG
jgi:CRP-like cAMP-binding protein